MDDVANRIAREMSDAIAKAVEDNPLVESVRERARAQGFELKVSMEAMIGFINREPAKAQKLLPAPNKDQLGQAANATTKFELTPNDRRFMRSLRIAADESAE